MVIRTFLFALLVFLLLASPGWCRAAREDSLKQYVDQIYRVESVYDPLIQELAGRGPDLLPYLVPKLGSYSRLFGLAAAWSIGQMGSSEAYLPVLEQFAWARNREVRTEAPTALVMLARDDRCCVRAMAERDSVRDAVELFCAAACESGMRFGHHGTPQDTVFVLTEDLPDTADLSCGERAFVFSRDSRRATARRPVGKPYVNFRATVCDVPSCDQTMPEWRRHMGEPPTALAVVTITTSTFLRPGQGDLGMEGSTKIWVKCGGAWELLTHYCRMMS